MPQALIQINGVTGSSFDLPIGTIVDLNNLNSGGETTYLWSIVDQPAGTADALSSTSVQSPTFTPKKEGTYLIQVIVNGASATPFVNSVIAVIRQVRTRIRVPAAQETTQGDTAEGWHGTPAHPGMEALLQTVDGFMADPGVIVGQVGTSHPARGAVCYMSAEATILSGLPGQALIGVFDAALASGTNVDGTVCVLEGGVDGSGSPAVGALGRFRFLGRFTGVTDPGAVGADMFVNDAGLLSSTPGTNRRKVGAIIAATAGVVDVFFDQAVFDEGVGTGFVHIAGSETITGQKTFAAGALVSAGQQVAGVAELNLNAATGQPVNLQIGSTTTVQATALGGLAITGAYEINVGGTNYPVVELLASNTVVGVGDIVGLGTGQLNLYVNGIPKFAVTATLSSLIPPTVYINGAIMLAYDGTTFTLGGGNTTGNTVVNAATGHAIAFDVNSVQQAQFGPTGGLSLGTTVDGGIGNLALTGSMAVVLAGTPYPIVQFGGGHMKLGDSIGGSGGTAWDAYIAGTNVLSITSTGATINFPAGTNLELSGASAVSLSAGAFTVGNGATTSANLILATGGSKGIVVAQGGLAALQSTTLTGTASDQVQWRTLKADSTAGTVTITLVAANAVPQGTRKSLKDFTGHAATHAIVWNAGGGDNIDGSSSLQFNHNFTCANIESDGSHTWSIISEHLATAITNY